MQFTIIESHPLAAVRALAWSGLFMAGLLLSACNEEGSTGPAGGGKITLNSPKGGESFKVGDSLRVKWTVKDDPSDPVDLVDVLLSPDAGMTWVNLLKVSIPVNTASWGNFAWMIKDSVSIEGVKTALAGNTKCLVRVKQYSTNDPKEISTTASTFTISAQ